MSKRKRFSVVEGKHIRSLRSDADVDLSTIDPVEDFSTLEGAIEKLGVSGDLFVKLEETGIEEGTVEYKEEELDYVVFPLKHKEVDLIGVEVVSQDGEKAAVAVPDVEGEDFTEEEFDLVVQVDGFDEGDEVLVRAITELFDEVLDVLAAEEDGEDDEIFSDGDEDQPNDFRPTPPPVSNDHGDFVPPTEDDLPPREEISDARRDAIATARRKKLRESLKIGYVKKRLVTDQAVILSEDYFRDSVTLTTFLESLKEYFSKELYHKDVSTITITDEVGDYLSKLHDVADVPVQYVDRFLAFAGYTCDARAWDLVVMYIGFFGEVLLQGAMGSVMSQLDDFVSIGIGVRDTFLESKLSKEGIKSLAESVVLKRSKGLKTSVNKIVLTVSSINQSGDTRDKFVKALEDLFDISNEYTHSGKRGVLSFIDNIIDMPYVSVDILLDDNGFVADDSTKDYIEGIIKNVAIHYLINLMILPIEFRVNVALSKLRGCIDDVLSKAAKRPIGKSNLKTNLVRKPLEKKPLKTKEVSQDFEFDEVVLSIVKLATDKARVVYTNKLSEQEITIEATKFGHNSFSFIDVVTKDIPLVTNKTFSQLRSILTDLLVD